MTENPYSHTPHSKSSFGTKGFLVSPSDTTDLPRVAKTVVVASAGSLALLPSSNPDNHPVLYEHCPVGFIPPFLVRRVLATGTDATVYTVEE